MKAFVLKYILKNSTDRSTPFVKIIAKKICDKFKKFRVNVAGKNMEAFGHFTVAHALHDGLMCRCRKSLNASNVSTSDGENEQPKKRKNNEYGCTEGKFCLTILPERRALLEDKRIELLGLFNDNIFCRDEQVRQIMIETYDLQRINIVGEQKKALSVLLSDWPYFKAYSIMFIHADQLIGRNVETTWNERLHEKAKYTRGFLEVLDSTKQKNKQHDTFVVNLLKEAKKMKVTLSGSEVPKIVAIFPLIIHYFSEEQSLLFKTVEVS